MKLGKFMTDQVANMFGHGRWPSVNFDPWLRGWKGGRPWSPNQILSLISGRNPVFIPDLIILRTIKKISILKSVIGL